MLSPIKKILLARAHRVSVWLEGVTSLITCKPMPTLEDLATLGWETAAQFLWMKSNNFPNSQCFRRDAIKCLNCSSSSGLIKNGYSCGHIASDDAELILTGSASPISGTFDHLVILRLIQCAICNGNPFSYCNISCNLCATNTNYSHYVRISTLSKLIEDMFGEEMKDYEPSLPDSS